MKKHNRSNSLRRIFSGDIFPFSSLQRKGGHMMNLEIVEQKPHTRMVRICRYTSSMHNSSSKVFQLAFPYVQFAMMSCQGSFLLKTFCSMESLDLKNPKQKIHLLPLPNIGADAVVCFGDSLGDVLELFKAVVGGANVENSRSPDIDSIIGEFWSSEFTELMYYLNVRDQYPTPLWNYDYWQDISKEPDIVFDKSLWPILPNPLEFICGNTCSPTDLKDQLGVF